MEDSKQSLEALCLEVMLHANFQREAIKGIASTCQVVKFYGKKGHGSVNHDHTKY